MTPAVDNGSIGQAGLDAWHEGSSSLIMHVASGVLLNKHMARN